MSCVKLKENKSSSCVNTCKLFGLFRRVGAPSPRASHARPPARPTRHGPRTAPRTHRPIYQDQPVPESRAPAARAQASAESRVRELACRGTHIGRVVAHATVATSTARRTTTRRTGRPASDAPRTRRDLRSPVRSPHSRLVCALASRAKSLRRLSAGTPRDRTSHIYHV